MMRKFLSLVMIAALSVASFTSCSSSADEKWYKDTTEEVTADLFEFMDSDYFEKIYVTFDGDFEDIIDNADEFEIDKEEPIIVVDLSEEVTDKIIGKVSSADIEDYSDDIENFIRNTLVETLAVQITNRHGVVNVAASSACSFSKTYDVKSSTSELWYVILENGDGVLLVFIKDSEDSTRVKANYIFASLTEDFDFEDSIKDFVGKKNIKEIEW